MFWILFVGSGWDQIFLLEWVKQGWTLYGVKQVLTSFIVFDVQMRFEFKSFVGSPPHPFIH